MRSNHLAKLSIKSFHFTFTTYLRTGDPICSSVLIFIKVYASRTKYLAVDLAKPTSNIKEIDKARAFCCSLEYQLYKVHTRMKTACEKRTKTNSLRASSSDSQTTPESELLSESTRTSYGHEEKTSDQHSWHADSTKLRNRCLPSDGNKGPKVYLGNRLQSLELRKGRMMIPCNNDSGPLSHGNNKADSNDARNRRNQYNDDFELMSSGKTSSMVPITRSTPNEHARLCSDSTGIKGGSEKVLKKHETGEVSETQRPAQSTFSEKTYDGFVFIQYNDHPGALVVYRSPEERAANPERLNLDRRRLTVCPILKSEEQVRLLNYQSNYIKEIQNLVHLPNLIFLDLYNNRIENLSHDLGCVPTLRVLMLGKNRIRAISHLDKLVKLDVLDLHSNAITKIEQLGALSELRVLNLAGNRLTEIKRLSNLKSLTELNVRRNHIVKATSLQQLQSLQRLFLSNNCIQSFDSIVCVFGIRCLMELSMDGNPIALQDPTTYRRYVIEQAKKLRLLDLKRVTDAERRLVALESQKEVQRQRAAKRRETVEAERRRLRVERSEAIRAAETQWTNQTSSRNPDTRHNTQSRYILQSMCTGSLSLQSNLEQHECNVCRRPKRCDAVNKYGNISSDDTHLPGQRCLSCTQATLVTAEHPIALSSGSSGALVARSVCAESTATSIGGSNSSAHIAMGYYEVEIRGAHREERMLQVYGEAWEGLNSPKITGSCTALTCRFVSIERIIRKLQPHVHSFVKLKKATFGNNAVHTLCQLLHLASVVQGLPNALELKIESNPVCSLTLLRPLICGVFTNVECFNGTKVSHDDQFIFSEQFGPIRDAGRRKVVLQTGSLLKRDGCDAFNHIISSSTTNALGIEEYRRLLDRYAEPSQHMTINLRLGAGLPPWTCWSMNAWTTIIHVLHPLQASPFGYSKAQLIS